jgi:hypothetical protein
MRSGNSCARGLRFKTSPTDESAGDHGGPASVPAAWSSSTNLDKRPEWPRCANGDPWALGCGGAPHGHWRTMTFLGALRCDQLTAPCVFDGPTNANASAPMSNSSSFPSQQRRHRHHGQSRQPQVGSAPPLKRGPTTRDSGAGPMQCGLGTSAPCRSPSTLRKPSQVLNQGR